MANISFQAPTDYSTEAADIDRRRKYAELLQQQSMEGVPLPQTPAGGFTPNISWTQGLAQMLKGYAGRKGLDEATARSKDLSGRRNQALADALGAMPRATPGQPEQWTGAPEEPAVYQPAQQGQQPSMQQNAAWLGRLGQIGPDAVQMGGTVLGMQQKQDENALNRESKTLDRIMALEAAAIQAGATRESQAAARKEAEQLRRDLAADSNRRAREMQTSQQAFMENQNRQAAADRAANRPAQTPVVVIGSNGKPEFVAPQNAYGRQPWAGSPGAQSAKPLTATAQREIIQTDEEIQGGAQALQYLAAAKKINQQAMGGFGSGAIATAGSMLPDAMRPAKVDATIELDNILQSSALPQLKAIFGGMPTEGERKILLEVQGSSSKPAKVREDIFNRAEAAVKNRLKFAQDKAKALREGKYFSGDGGVNPAGSGASGDWKDI